MEGPTLDDLLKLWWDKEDAAFDEASETYVVTKADIRDRLDDVVELVNAQGGPVVLPAGFGKGYGLFADVDYVPTDPPVTITYYGGAPVPEGTNGEYVLSHSGGQTLDGYHGFLLSEKGRWINEPSSECSANARFFFSQNEQRITVVCTRPIRVGEEITLLYGDEYQRRWQPPPLTVEPLVPVSATLALSVGTAESRIREKLSERKRFKYIRRYTNTNNHWTEWIPKDYVPITEEWQAWIAQEYETLQDIGSFLRGEPMLFNHLSRMARASGLLTTDVDLLSTYFAGKTDQEKKDWLSDYESTIRQWDKQSEMTHFVRLQHDSITLLAVGMYTDPSVMFPFPEEHTGDGLLIFNNIARPITFEVLSTLFPMTLALPQPLSVEFLKSCARWYASTVRPITYIGVMHPTAYMMKVLKEHTRGKEVRTKGNFLWKIEHSSFLNK